MEELSKATLIGTQLREYDNPNFDALRNDVFNMVRDDAFKEYRDARFIKEFHDDPDKWAQLKSGEKHVASRLAMDVKTNAGSIKTKLSAVDQQVARAIDRNEIQFDEDDIESLQRAVVRIQEQMHPGVRPFRVGLIGATKLLSEASMSDVKALSAQDMMDFKEAHDYFAELHEKHWKAS